MCVNAIQSVAGEDREPHWQGRRPRFVEDAVHETGADAASAPGVDERDVDDEHGVQRACGDDPAGRRAVAFDDLEAGVRILRAVARRLSGKLLPHQPLAERRAEKAQILARRAGRWITAATGRYPAAR
ncbi:MAG: hypothetical protein DLM68_02040 [Hyphomicrobiales bacterium]|nr:MAG: hypothetical protein DLM68_02040 [Hyphomicrobiales bacterium]